MDRLGEELNFLMLSFEICKEVDGFAPDVNLLKELFAINIVDLLGALVAFEHLVYSY